MILNRTSTVKLQGGLELDFFLGARRFGVGLLCSVQTGHIGLMVLGMVQAHDLAGDMRLKSLQTMPG